MFSVTERIGLLKDLYGDNVEITSFGGLLVDHVREVDADVVVKGLRTVDDYEYETQMAQMNRHLTGMETLFIPTRPEFAFYLLVAGQRSRKARWIDERSGPRCG